MELEGFGVDTLRLSAELVKPLPVLDDAFLRELVPLGWSVNRRLDFNDVIGVFDSHTMSWQDSENSTIRAFVSNAGRTLITEFSVPRILDASPINLHLANYDECLSAYDFVLGRLRSVSPVTTVDSVKVRRFDMAADVAAGDAKAGLIAASGQIVVPGARKITRQIFPGETGRVSTPSLTFRGYDKARELTNKTDKLLNDLEVSKRLEILQKMQERKESGTVRLEAAFTPKKGSFTFEDVGMGNIRWADVIDNGLNGGRVYIGGLDAIRAQIDARRKVYESPPIRHPTTGRIIRRSVSGDLSAQSANALLAFAVRYAELGEEGMLQVMSRATFYRHKKAFTEAGLKLEDLTTYHGEIDLTGIVKQVRAG